MFRSSYGKSKGKHLQNLQNQTRLKLTLLIKTVDEGETLPKKPAKITDMRDSLVRFTKADIIYLFIYLFIYLSIYLFMYLFIYLFIYLSIYLFIYLSIYSFIYLFIYLFISVGEGGKMRIC